MKRAFEVKNPIRRDEYETVLSLAPSEIERCALESNLLYFELIESLSFYDSFGAKVILKKAASGADKSRSLATLKSDSVIEFFLPENQLGALCANFLRYFRDCGMEVNHFHLESILNRRSFDLTIFFKKS